MLVIVAGRLLIGCVVIELICLILSLISKNRDTIINCSIIFEFCIAADVLLTLYYLFNTIVELVSKLDTWSSFLKLSGASVLNLIAAVLVLTRVIMPASEKPGLKKTRKRKEDLDLRTLMYLNPQLKVTIYLLLAGCLIKLGGDVLSFLFGITFISNLIPLPISLIYFVSSLCMIAFLFMCAFTMNVKGMIAFSVIAALSSLLVLFAIFALELSIVAFILSAGLMALLSFTAVTGTAFGSVFFVDGIVSFIFVPVITPTIGAVPLAAGAGAGSALTSAAGSSAASSSRRSRNHLLTVLINIVIVFVFSIPLLSFTSGLSGIVRNKPAFIMGRQLFNRYNLILSDTDLFDMSTAELSCPIDIMKDRNGNCIQRTDDFNSDCSDQCISLLHSGVLQIIENNSSPDVLAIEACPIKNDENTVVLQLSDRTVVLGNEEMFVLHFKNKHFMYRRYPWRAKFLAMSEEEQMDHIYRLLFEEYAGKESAPIQDAALLKLSAQKGQLIHYDLEEEVIYFGSANDDGTVTFWYQTAPGERSEIATVTASMPSGRVPYIWGRGENVILCADGPSRFLVYPDGEVTEKITEKSGDILSFNIYYSENSNLGLEFVFPELLAYYKPDEGEWGHYGLAPGISYHCSGLLHAGDKHILSWYDDDFLHKYTFLLDKHRDDTIIDRIMENMYYPVHIRIFTD